MTYLESFKTLILINLHKNFKSIKVTAMHEFSTRFSQFKEFKETIKLIIYPDTLSFKKN